MRYGATALFVAASLASAGPAMAVDMVGYFRDGFTANSKGGGATCFKTPGMDYKLRLGNECDAYGEWGLQQTLVKDGNGVEWSVGVMLSYDPDNATPNGTTVPIAVQQNWVKARFPQLGGAQFWAGKQYYRRENIDMIDFFYLNTSDVGIGIEDVDLGFGKLAFSVFGAQGPTHDRIYLRPDLRIYGVPVNPGGTLEVDVNVTSIERNTDADPKGANDASVGFWATVEHEQAFLGNSSNKLVVQWANANASNMGGATPGFTLIPDAPGDADAATKDSVKAAQVADSINKNNQQFRVLDQLLLQPTRQFQILVGAVYQQKTYASSVDNSKSKFQQLGVFTRPVFYVNDYFKLQGDAGYTSNKPEHADTLSLFKATLAPTLTPSVGPSGGFFVRPEIRVFVTYASWNDATNVARPGGASTQVDFGADKKSGMTYGAQVETWF